MGNPINAQTDADSGLRFYQWNDQRLLSVTSLRKALGMPFGLAWWQVNQVVEAAIQQGTSALHMSEDEQREYLRKAAVVKRDEAAALGTSVHEAAEQHVLSGTLSENDVRKPFLVQYEKWQAAMQPTILVQECQVFNLKEGYAGSLDFIADLAKRRWLVDIKTGKGTYTDHALQGMLYYSAEFVGGYDPISDSDVMYPEQSAIFDQCDGVAILHLRPEGWEWIPIALTDELAAAALDVVRLGRFFLAHPTIETLRERNP